MPEMIADIRFQQWLVLAVCGFLIGVAKTGIPGVGILVVPIMAWAFAARESVGILLGILIIADVFAAIFYRYKARFREILHLLPSTGIGVLLGAYLMGNIDDAKLKCLIGIIVLALLAARQAALFLAGGDKNKVDSVAAHWGCAIGFGFMAGFTSMLANAAGPVMVLYLLALRLEKTEFVGTAAWYFFILNWMKVPSGISLGMFTPQSLWMDAATIPAIIAGAMAGIFALKKLPQKIFEIITMLLTAAAAVKLLF